MRPRPAAPCPRSPPAWLALLVLAALATGCRVMEREPDERLPPPMPMGDDLDWVQLVSGEWLAGEVERMRDDVLVMDSKELDDLRLDWDDVAQVWIPRPMSCLFIDFNKRRGTLHVNGDVVSVETEDGAMFRYPREQLLAFVPRDESERSLWSGKVSVGYSKLSGNTDQEDWSTLINIRRDTADSVLRLDYTGIITSVNGSETANNHWALLTHTVQMTPTTYAIPVYVNYWADRFKNIDYQVTPAALLGSHLIDEVDMEWKLAFGAGAEYTKFSSVEAGEDDTQLDPVSLLLTEFEVDITKDVDFTLNYTYQSVIGSARDNTQRVQAGLSIDITNEFDLDLTFIWTRVGDPQPDASGDTPKKDDTSITFGLGYEF